MSHVRQANVRQKVKLPWLMPEPRGLNIYFRQASISAMSLTNAVEAKEATRVGEKRYIKKKSVMSFFSKVETEQNIQVQSSNRLEMFLEAVKVRDWREASV